MYQSKLVAGLDNTTREAARLLLSNSTKQANELWARVEQAVTMVVAGTVELADSNEIAEFNDFKFARYTEARNVFNGYGIKQRGKGY